MNISTEALEQMESRFRATLINSLPGFKCLHLVGTMGAGGHSNLGLFNSTFHLGAAPALLGIVFRPGSQDHDTLANIQRTGVYTLNNVLEPFYQQAHQTSARYASGCSEFLVCGLKERFMPNFEAPFVAESTIQIGMELSDVIPVKRNGTTLVIGEIVQILVNDDLIAQDGYINHERAGTLTVSGLDSYFRTSFLARLAYAKPEQPIKYLPHT